MKKRAGVYVLRIALCSVSTLLLILGLFFLMFYRKTGAASLSSTIQCFFWAGIALWLMVDGIARLGGLLGYTILKRRGQLRQRYTVYLDGIHDGSREETDLPYAFVRFSEFGEDRRHFYLLRGKTDCVFDKAGFTTGTPDAFRLFIRRELRALLRDEDEER